jgi:hypothetical protein
MDLDKEGYGTAVAARQLPRFMNLERIITILTKLGWNIRIWLYLVV